MDTNDTNMDMESVVREVREFSYEEIRAIAAERGRVEEGGSGRQVSAASLAIRIINTRDRVRNALALAVNQREPDAEIARWGRLLVHMMSVVEWYNALLANPHNQFASEPLV